MLVYVGNVSLCNSLLIKSQGRGGGINMKYEITFNFIDKKVLSVQLNSLISRRAGNFILTDTRYKQCTKAEWTLFELG